MQNYHSLVPSHEKLIFTLTVTAEQNIWMFQYRDENFTEKKLTSWCFNNIPAIAKILIKRFCNNACTSRTLTFRRWVTAASTCSSQPWSRGAEKRRLGEKTYSRNFTSSKSKFCSSLHRKMMILAIAATLQPEATSWASISSAPSPRETNCR